MGIIDRIKLFIDYKHISMRQFCNTIGIANGAFTKVKSVGSETLSKIIYTFPELNIIWLISGCGDMLVSQAKISEPMPEMIEKILQKKDERIEQLVEANTILKLENKNLRKKLYAKSPNIDAGTEVLDDFADISDITTNSQNPPPQPIE